MSGLGTAGRGAAWHCEAWHGRRSDISGRLFLFTLNPKTRVHTTDTLVSSNATEGQFLADSNGQLVVCIPSVAPFQSGAHMFALVSTVNSMGPTFPNHCVMLFKTEQEAIELAIHILFTHGEVTPKPGENLWQVSELGHFETQEDALGAWQEAALGMTEYFHVMKVEDIPKPVRELFLDRDHETFITQIERMNSMYRLQVSSIPTLTVVDNNPDGSQEKVGARTRLQRFKKTMLEEIGEIDQIIEMVEGPVDEDTARNILVAIADLTADLIVFCVSEQRKFGLPPAAVMKIVMESNMSKLQPDGSAKYDDKGKFLKGPNYYPPEPKLRDLINKLLQGYGAPV